MNTENRVRVTADSQQLKEKVVKVKRVAKVVKAVVVSVSLRLW